MARLYENGFELQTVTTGFEWSGATTGSPTINTTTKRSGAASLRVNPTAAAWYFTHRYKTAGTANNDYLRFYIRIASATNTAATAIALFRSATSGNICSIRLNTDNTLELWNEQVPAQRGSDSAALSANTWYRVELEYRRSSSTIHGYINGVEFATGAQTNTYTTEDIRVGAIDSCTADIYYDDIAVNDSTGSSETSLPGPGRLSLALPNAAGDNAADTGLYSYINELPPSDTATSGSTMIELDTSSSIGDYNVTSSNDLGIGTNDIIKVISVLARVREQAAGTSNYTLRVKSASGGTTTASASVDAGDATARTNPSGTTTFGTRLVSYLDPTTGVAWTKTGTNSIDNMQIGAATTDGNPDVWVLWLGAYVEFTEPFSLSQTEAAFYEDGTESGSTVIDSGADSIPRDVSSGDSNLQLRVRLQEANYQDGASTDDYQLQYEVNDSGSFANIGVGATIDSYGESNQSVEFSISAAAGKLGQSFKPSAASTIASAELYIRKEGSPTGTLNAKIYAHTGTYGSGGTPTGAALAVSDNFDLSTLTTTLALVSLTFSGANAISLTGTTAYFLTLELSGATVDVSNNVRWGADTSSPTHAGNGASYFSSWGAEPDDFIFYVRGAGPVIGFNSGSLTDGDATTNRLGSGTGSFVAGEISEDGLVDNHQITAGNYTEYLYSLTLVSSALADTDTLDFRVLRNGAVIDSYAITPRITVEIAGGDDHTLVTQDSALSLTIDATTITQNHVIQPQDIALALTEDNTTITQNHVVATQDIALSLTEDNTTITQTHVLPTQDIALSLTEDNTTVTETNFALVVQDIAHTLTTDNTTITQNHIVAVQDIALALTEDNATVSQNHLLTAQDIALALTTDNTTVAETNFILAVQDIALALSEDNTTITQVHIIATQDIALALSEDNTTVTQNHIVVAQDIILALTEDEATITQTNFVLTAQDITHALTTDNTTITQNHLLTAQDIALALLEDNTTLTQDHIVVAQDIALVLTMDNTTIDPGTLTIAVQDIALALTADNTTVTETNFVLIAQDIAHSLTLDNTTINQNHVVTAQDIALALTEDNTTISQNQIVVVQDIALALTEDNTTITQIHSLAAQDVALVLTLDNTTITQVHVLMAQDILLTLSLDNTSVSVGAFTSGFKYFDGAVWTIKPLKFYTGSAWQNATLKRYDGVSWVNIEF